MLDNFPTIETWMSTVKVSYYLNSGPVEAVAPWIVPSCVPYGVVVELGYPVKKNKKLKCLGFVKPCNPSPIDNDFIQQLRVKTWFNQNWNFIISHLYAM